MAPASSPTTPSSDVGTTTVNLRFPLRILGHGKCRHLAGLSLIIAKFIVVAWGPMITNPFIHPSILTPPPRASGRDSLLPPGPLPGHPHLLPPGAAPGPGAGLPPRPARYAQGPVPEQNVCLFPTTLIVTVHSKALRACFVPLGSPPRPPSPPWFRGPCQRSFSSATPNATSRAGVPTTRRSAPDQSFARPSRRLCVTLVSVCVESPCGLSF